MPKSQKSQTGFWDHLRKMCEPKKIMALLVAAVLILAGGAANQVVNDFWGKHLPLNEQMLVENAERDLKIQDALASLRNEAEAQRTTIFLLHNGGFWSYGDPVTKASCVYESVSDQAAHRIDVLQSIKLSRMPTIIRQLSAEDAPFARHVSDVTGGFWANVMLLHGTETAAFVPLRLDDTLAGFIMVEFDAGTDLEPVYEVMSRYRRSIEFLFDHHSRRGY